MAFTEFYCDAANGNNLWAGSTTSTTPYTKTAGNWVNGTRVYTVQDGTNPSLSVNVGDFASVYPDGSAAPAVFIGRVTAVQNATNGTITIDATALTGTSPTNGTANRTIVVGGVWKGPTGASGFPFNLTPGSLKNAGGDQVRINLKNNSSYSVTAAYSYGSGTQVFVTQGYSSTPGDGGKATIDGGTSTGSLITGTGVIGGHIIVDVIFTTSITTGTPSLVTTGTVQTVFIRCVFKGARNIGLNTSASIGCSIIECEIYDCNKANTVSIQGLAFGGGQIVRTFIHDNAGSNTEGLRLGGGSGTWYIRDCVIDTNGNNGITLNSTSRGGIIIIQNCDIYNNGGDGINILSANLNHLWIENCNFIKNTGAGINNGAAASSLCMGFTYNCGYGAGTQANGSGDTLGNITKTGAVTYASGAVPWVDGPNGDFRINLAAANWAGRGAFTETQGYSAPNSVAYPDIGAVQSKTGSGGTFSKEVSYGFSS